MATSIPPVTLNRFFRRPNEDPSRSSLTIYLDEYLKGVLHAEAIASDKSVSALAREWMEERLDLPGPG